jgi:hypothetical protein
VSEHRDLAGLRQQAVSDAAALVSQAKAESEHLLAVARSEAEAMRASAQLEAEAIIAAAENQAVVIDERGRQEFFWRRRQLRQQHDLLTRWKRAMESQLASINSFAVETARGLYEVQEPPSPGEVGPDTGSADGARQLAHST